MLLGIRKYVKHMSKKVNKSKAKEIINEGTNTVPSINADIKYENNTNEFVSIPVSSLTEDAEELEMLLNLEKACALVCKHHETIARIDSTNSEKFKEYKRYYEIIFSKISDKISQMIQKM